MYVEGGDPIKASPIVDKSTGEVTDSYKEWVETIDDPRYLSIADFVSDGLRPIYELAKSEDRKALLKSDWEKFLKAKTGSIVDAATPELVFKDASIKLASEDGRYLGSSYSGTSYYFAFIRSEGTPHKLGGIHEPLVNGSNVNLITTEMFKDNFWGHWSQRTWLGAFWSDNQLYYWDPKEGNTNWIFEKVDTTTGVEIHYGDEVYIKNEAYENQYLKLAGGGYLTTRKNEKYRWRIVKA